MPGFLIRALIAAGLLALLVAALFWPGLHGSFYYDDHPHIVNNHTLQITQLNLSEISRAAHSSNAGPFGRPLAMASFAVEHVIAGLAPFHFKLTNLLLHLTNALLAAWLMALLLRAAYWQQAISSSPMRWLPLWVAAFWALHPLTASSVLYVVQRMTLLAALFALLAMISYCSGRMALMRRSGGWLRAFLAPPLLILAGIYSKETAIVAVPILALIEAWVLRCRMADETATRTFRRIFIVLAIAGMALASWELYRNLPSFLALYQWREFTLAERLLTEARVLWQYIGLTVVPDFRNMALFHDDFPVSSGLLQPATTLLSILGLIALLVLALAARKRAPLVALGVGWFLVAHLPESTIIPLELMHEHRNYFPLLGLVLAIVAALHHLSARLPAIRPRVFLVAGGCLLAVMGLSTFARTMEMGDAQGYFVHEALRHPGSARSNTEAAFRLIDLAAANPGQASQLGAQAQLFLDRAIAASANEIHAPFAGIMAQPFLSDNDTTRYYQILLRRLETNLPHRSTPSLFASLNQMLLNGRITMAEPQVDALYQAALRNPRLAGKTETDMLVTYASYQVWLRGDMGQALALIDTAAAKPGADPGVNLVRASIYLTAGKLDETRALLDAVEKSDATGYYDAGVAQLKRKLEAARP